MGKIFKCTHKGSNSWRFQWRWVSKHGVEKEEISWQIFKFGIIITRQDQEEKEERNLSSPASSCSHLIHFMLTNKLFSWNLFCLCSQLNSTQNPLVNHARRFFHCISCYVSTLLVWWEVGWRETPYSLIDDAKHEVKKREENEIKSCEESRENQETRNDWKGVFSLKMERKWSKRTHGILLLSFHFAFFFLFSLESSRPASFIKKMMMTMTEKTGCDIMVFFSSYLSSIVLPLFWHLKGCRLGFCQLLRVKYYHSH